MEFHEHLENKKAFELKANWNLVDEIMWRSYGREVSPYDAMVLDPPVDRQTRLGALPIHKLRMLTVNMGLLSLSLSYQKYWTGLGREYDHPLGFKITLTEEYSIRQF